MSSYAPGTIQVISGTEPAGHPLQTIVNTCPKHYPARHTLVKVQLKIKLVLSLLRTFWDHPVFCNSDPIIRNLPTRKSYENKYLQLRLSTYVLLMWPCWRHTPSFTDPRENPSNWGQPNSSSIHSHYAHNNKNMCWSVTFTFTVLELSTESLCAPFSRLRGTETMNT